MKNPFLCAKVKILNIRARNDIFIPISFAWEKEIVFLVRLTCIGLLCLLFFAEDIFAGQHMLMVVIVLITVYNS